MSGRVCGLYQAGQRDVLELIRRLTRDRGSTVLVSTHLLAEVEAVCSRAVILNRGRVVADGSVVEVARRAAAPRTVRVHVGADHVAHALVVLRRAEPVVGAEARPQTVPNFLEQREAVSLTLQVAVAAGALLTLLSAADAVSGERERGTLEAMLLSPAPRWQLVAGKGAAALSLWLAAFVVATPYVWFLGHGVDLVAVPLASGLLVGSLLALAFTGIGLTVSCLASTNRISLGVSLFILFAFYAPSQFPTGAQSGWAGELLQRLNPLTAGLHYLGWLTIDAHGAADDAGWLVAPVAAAAVCTAAALAVSNWLTLTGARR